MKDKKIKRIPYGVANYELLVQQNSYYVDKTTFLPVVEEAGNRKEGTGKIPGFPCWV